ncbi:MAG: MarR family transcriptional regulator [Deltaproteobacteria bacterium]|nr:MarR family transcriptional regulator [Deltaproteobacteria bacterium]
MGTNHKTFLYLMRYGKWLDTIYNRALKREGMTVTQYETLLCLLEEGSLTPGAVNRRLGSDSGSLPRIVDRLEREGWARRTPNKENASSVLLELTADGKRKMVKVLEKVRQTTKALTSELSDKELSAFTEGLDKLMKAARELRQ